MTATIATSLRRLHSAGLTPPDRTRGCSGDELALLESKLGVRLPATCREFLQALGHDAGSFMVGSDFCFDRLLDLQVEARELAGEGLPRTAFAYLMHQGYEFLFFLVGDGSDPQVHRFEEGGAGTPLGLNFSAWLGLATDDEIRLSRLSRATTIVDSLDEARRCASRDLLRLYNETWLDEEIGALDEAGFCARLGEPSVTLHDETGGATAYFRDGGMFAGHWVVVGFDGGRPTDADIAG